MANMVTIIKINFNSISWTERPIDSKLSTKYWGNLMMNKAVWRTAISPAAECDGAASKFKAQTGGLQLWPWPWVCIVELWVLHIISLRRTFDPNLINIFQRVQEIRSEHEIQGSNSWPLTVILTLSRHTWVMGSAHRLTKATIWPKFHENLSKGSGDMKQTRKRRMTFSCDLDLKSASLSYRFYTSSQ